MLAQPWSLGWVGVGVDEHYLRYAKCGLNGGVCTSKQGGKCMR
jgi:hypothetical protein